MHASRAAIVFSAPTAYLTHQQKVLRLYKRALCHLELWCIHRDKYQYFACLMRAQFEEHKHEKDMRKVTQLLREAEEFWYRQHPQPCIFPDSPGGTSYERYECYKVSEWCLDDWHSSEKAMYPDFFAKREQWKKLRRESWEQEVKQLAEETPPGGPLTEALPPALKDGDLPSPWWHIVTRPRDRPV
ncbi:NADH dehydrogenase [ubiquinone] 1 beta subcomplex subunit 9-like [Nycticebus coucang]|uniref:NADH dehydrogenase [ubiquinone] 1 beta subcomplex subunit 9-like n=1 Tax=Nycticebus coucang TaxID=9470 RepID=UPI00234D2E81|nr:NADH dehydrogenase [ubiquinone] 1 beta subcomplex subunit 9-like [Nycticebus coucang]